MRRKASAKWRKYPDRGKVYLLCFTGVGGRMGIVFLQVSQDSGCVPPALPGCINHQSPASLKKLIGKIETK